MVPGSEPGNSYPRSPTSATQDRSRIVPVLRISGQNPMKRIELTGGHVDLESGSVAVDGRDSALRPAEIGLLRHLAERPNQTVSRDELLATVFGYRRGLRSRTVDTTVGRIRARIERDPAAPRHVVTDKHLGYRFVPLDLDPSIPTVGVSVGRDAELASVRRWLEDEQLVVVVGPPGVGATHFAATVAAQSSHPTWIDLATGDDRPLPDAGLAVLDGVDDQDLSAIPTHLRDHPALRVLVIARRLPAIGGRILELGPLSPEDGAAMARLLADRAGIPLDDADALRLSVRSEGLPLAIRVRVLLLRTVPIAEVLSPSPLPALVELTRNSLARCAEEEIATLAALAVIRGPFGIEEATAVLGPTATTRLEAVRARSLSIRDGAHLRLLSVVRDAVFAADPTPYWRWLAERASASVPGIDGPDAKAVLDTLGLRLADLDAAVDGLVDDPAAREQAGIARDAWIRIRGTTRGRLAALDQLPDTARVHLLRSVALRDAGDADGARAALDRAGDTPDSRVERCALECLYGTPAVAEDTIRAATGLPLDRRQLGAVALAAGTLARRTNDLERSRERFHAALATWRSAGLDRLAALARMALSTPEILEERYEAAAVYLSDAVDGFAAAGDLRSLAPALQHLGIVWSELGRFDEAEAAYLESLRFETEGGRMPSVANLHTNLAHLAHDRGQLDAAERWYREAIGLLREHCELGTVAMPLAHLGLLLLEQGRKAPARAACDEARELADTHVRPRAAAFARLVVTLLLPPERAREEVLAIAASGVDETLVALLIVCRARIDGDRAHARSRLEVRAERSAAARIALRVLDVE